MLKGCIVSVNVGTATPASFGGRDFVTAIRKAPVYERLRLVDVNVTGDGQADRIAHGGPNKAVYAYSFEDYSWWQTQGVAWRPGLFGENLTTLGFDVNAAIVGERWRIGTALLEVSEPRIPCYKLGYALSDPTFPQRFASALRPGSYLRIIEEGDIWPGCLVDLEYRPLDSAVTVRDAMRIRLKV